MGLQNTNLLIQMGQIPPTFVGTPNQFAAEMVHRMKIVSPSGTNFIFIGSVEPTSDVGPWLKNGNEWFVFNPEVKRYVPISIASSETRWYHISASVPSSIDPPLWLRTTRNATEEDPSYGDAIEWLGYTGTAWLPLLSDGRSGTTAQRPTAAKELQKFYDTDITCLLWWERSAWRTVSGVPGDLKAVAFPTLTEAIRRNPGWEVLGATNQSIRGRYLSQATKDSGPTPETILVVSAGVAERAAFETFGESDGVAIDPGSPVPYPPTLAVWHLVKT